MRRPPRRPFHSLASELLDIATNRTRPDHDVHANRGATEYVEPIARHPSPASGVLDARVRGHDTEYMEKRLRP